MSEPIERAYVVTLTIPDNEAFTALTALGAHRRCRRRLRSAPTCGSRPSKPSTLAALDAAIGTIETIYNPNKHELDVRADAAPRAGEVWITAHDETPAITVAGRTVAGVRGIVRRTAWRLARRARGRRPRERPRSRNRNVPLQSGFPKGIRS